MPSLLPCGLSIVIVTYNREAVLVDTIRSLQLLQNSSPFACTNAREILIIDQTSSHESTTAQALSEWDASDQIRWIRLPLPHLTQAMNRGLREAQGDLVLFVDDDIVPFPNLLEGHLKAHASYPEAWAVVGQILQPGQQPEFHSHRPLGSTLWRDLDFHFNGTDPAWIENVMAGNLSVKREHALTIGGFDECFPPPVAARFETEFAKRLIAAGGKIRFVPDAPLHHLAATSGGTRSQGSHLTSASPRYGIGDCYYAFRCGQGWERAWYLLRKPFREVRTRFHLRHPWWVPVKLLGELRALLRAWRLSRLPPQLLELRKCE